jgi:glycosyltransferase involved in cell wall biosynthesis
VRVAIDATPLLESPTGIGRVTRATIEALIAHTDLDIACYSVTWRGRGRMQDACPPGATAHARPVPARLAHRLWARTAIPWAELLAGDADVVHGMNYVAPPTRRASTVVSVHDLTFLHHPEWCTATVLRFPRLIQRAIDRGAFVHTGAEAIAAEIREAFDVDDDRVVAVHHGLDRDLGETALGGGVATIAGTYVLALGTIEPRKDYPTLVRAFDLLAADEPDLRLVVAGGEGWGSDEYHRVLATARARDRIVSLGYVDESTRRNLLRHAAVLAYPSAYEGFGLPPLEAMQVGVPVVTTDAGALPEVVGEAAEIVGVGDASALAKAMLNALDPARRAELIRAGTENIRRFDWADTARRLHDLYRSAAAA